MKHTTVVFLVILVFYKSVESKSIKYQWKFFKEQFNKTYKSTEEDIKRYKIFSENLQNINKHNARYEQGDETYLQEVNKFADLTDDEFTSLYGLYERSKPVKYNKNKLENVTEIFNNDTDSFDWRDFGEFTPAKNQLNCGSCYIFSAVGNLENYYYRKTGKLLSLSEQHVVDCLSNNTCGGGHPAYVFAFVMMFGIHLESDYPYTGKQQECRNDTQPRSNVTLETLGVVKGSDDDLKIGLKENGPLTTCFSVTAKWRFYKSGVWYHDECAQKSNHCVLVVGYGTEDGNDYWIIKNSWGSDWGDNGYIKMARNKHKKYCGFDAGLYVI